MKFQTMSLVAGTLACNARCPFCISGQTPHNGVEVKDQGLNLDRLRKACQIAEKGGVSYRKLKHIGILFQRVRLIQEIFENISCKEVSLSAGVNSLRSEGISFVTS
jgi:hypothetical protein